MVFDWALNIWIASSAALFNSLSPRERVGVRGFKKANALIIFPLIPAFSLREKV